MDKKIGSITLILVVIVITFVNRLFKKKQDKINEETDSIIKETTTNLVNDVFPKPDFSN